MMMPPQNQSWPVDQWSTLWAKRRQKDANSAYLLDPITAKERNVHHVPVDRLLDYSFLDKTAHNVKTLVYTLPKTVVKGLRGDNDFTQADFSLVGKIPYYLTGLVLMGGFLASGRKRLSAVRMGVGIGLYYLGVMAANALVDGFYRLRYGIDLGLRYKRSDGRVDKVFGSVDAPRFDLLTADHYEKMQEKMGIPFNLADRNQACREQIVRAISSSESLKIILGVLLAGIGAGQVARTNDWGVLLNRSGSVDRIWTDPKTGNILRRLKLTKNRLSEFFEFIFRDRLLLKKSAPVMQKVSLWGLLAVFGYALYQSLRVVQPKAYESTPLQAPVWSGQRLHSNGVFQDFVRYQSGREVQS